MKKTLVRATVIGIFSFLTIVSFGFIAIENGWVELKPENGKFSIMMPGEAKEFAQNDLKTDNGRINMRIFMYEPEAGKNDDNSIYLVNYKEYLSSTVSSDSSAKLEQFYKTANSEILKNIKGQLLSEVMVTKNGYKGKECRVEFENKIMDYRLFLVKNRLFMIEVICPKVKDPNKASQTFLDSFKLLN